MTCEVARDVMRTVVGGVAEFEPFIRFHTFGDSGIRFTIILRGREFTGQYRIRHEFVKRLQARYRVEGIVIPYPMRSLAWENPAQVSSESRVDG
jgi:small-conductance mechanosensitive channel